MADNKMLSNINDLTSAVGKLKQKIDDLYASVDKVAIRATDAIGGAQNILQQGGEMGLTQGSVSMNLGSENAKFPTGGAPGGNVMQNSLGKFTFSWQFNQAPYETSLLNPLFGGGGGGGSGGGGGLFDKFGFGVKSQFMGGAKAGAQIGLGLAAGAYAALPDMSILGQREVGLEQALRLGPGTRAMLNQQLTNGLYDGMSSQAVDAVVAPMLASRGFYPGTANYNLMVQQTRQAYLGLGIDNPAAVQGLSQIYSAPTGASLRSFGISTFDARTGTFRDKRAIAQDIANMMAQGNKFDADFISRSKFAGTYDPLLQQLFPDESARMQMEAELMSIATGKPIQNIDVLQSAGLMNFAQTRTMQNVAPEMVAGFSRAAVQVDRFNDAIDDVLKPLADLKGLISGIGGTNMGSAVAAAAPGIAGGINTIIATLKDTNSLMEAGALFAGIATGLGAISAGVAAMTAGTNALPTTKPQGGGSSGYGASFNANRLGGKGGGMYAAPQGMVTAMFGAKDSDLWASSGGTHTGTDIAMPIGTPVRAAMDGVISSIDAGPEYGTSLVIDHPDGYQTLYAHLSQNLASLGSYVKKGQVIAKSGQSGNTTGPHLHYEVRAGKNNPVDPNSLSSSSITAEFTSGDFISAVSPVASALNSYTNSITGNYTGVKGTGSKKTWASQLLGALGAPVTDANISALVTWSNYEGGHWKNSASYNPLNTTLDMGGNKSINKVGVKSYGSWEEGLNATVKTLLGNRSSERGYAAIVDALRNNAGTSAVLSAVNQSAWVHGEGRASNYKFPRGGGSPTPTMSNGDAKTVNITVTFNQADDVSAMRFAKQVKQYLEHENTNHLIGSN